MLRSDNSNTDDGINNNTYQILFGDDLENFSPKIDNTKEFIFSLIDSITLLSDKEVKIVTRRLKNLKQRGLSKKNRHYIVNKDGLEYKFEILDKFVSDELKERLRSEKRYGECVSSSIYLAYNNPKNSKILIGRMNLANSSIIHSVFCIKKDDNREYVFDFTRNLVMKKDDYFDLTNFELINEVKSEYLKEDLKKLKNIGMSTKPYLMCRDEIMNDLNKNKKVLKLED